MKTMRMTLAALMLASASGDGIILTPMCGLGVLPSH
jgi:hypothetical protein